MLLQPLRSTLFPYTTLFRSGNDGYARYQTLTGASSEGYRSISITDPGNAEGVITVGADRKSTRLNSSHGYISYAVFCLNKKISQTIICINLSTSSKLFLISQ